jgi:hypothetical protein
MVAAAVSFGAVGSLVGVSLPLHVHVGLLCVRFSRALRLSGVVWCWAAFWV